MGKAPTKKPLKAKSAKSAVRSGPPAARAAITAKKASAPVTTTAKAIAKPVAKTSKPAIELKPKTPVIETKKAVVPAKGLTKPAPLTKSVQLNKPAAVTKSVTLSKAAPSNKQPSTLAKPAISNKSASPKNHAPPVIVAAPIPTDGKPRKNQAGIGLRELEHFRELLLAKRRELLGDMSSMEREALRATGSNLSNLPIHMADMGTDNYEQEFTLGLVEKDRQLLREINIALGKIQDGTYGLCEGTGKPISKQRLEAQPWAKYSIEHAREQERRGIRR